MTVSWVLVSFVACVLHSVLFDGSTGSATESCMSGEVVAAGYSCGHSSTEGESAGQARGAHRENSKQSWGGAGTHDEAPRTGTPACEAEEEPLLPPHGGVDALGDLCFLATCILDNPDNRAFGSL